MVLLPEHRQAGLPCDTPDISVVVLTHNGRRWLADCLSALAAQTCPAVECILVDNQSTDGSAGFVRETFPWVRVVELDHNAGFAAGNNAGARVARGRFLAFLNNDTIADPGWLGALRAALDARPDAGMAASLIVYLHDPTVVDSAGDGYTRWGGAFKRHHGEVVPADLAAADVFGACGAACLFRRDVFDAVGGFDEDLFLIYEDVDLSYRVQLRGHACVFVPTARVRHAGSATLGTVSRTSVFYGQRNLEWVYVKNTPARQLFTTLPGHVLYSLAGGAYLASAGHLGTWVSAKWAAVRGLAAILRKRRAQPRPDAAQAARVAALMERRWLARKWREKRFDLGRGRAAGAQRS